MQSDNHARKREDRVSLEIATRPNGVDALPAPTDLLPRFVVGLKDMVAQVRALDAFKDAVLQDGTDYAVIPGTPKPSLLKPGAEKVCEAFGYWPRFETVREIQEWEGGFFYYQVRCTLVSKRTGELAGDGLGSCNSKEGKYR